MKEARKTLLLGMGGAGAALASALCCAGPLLAMAAVERMEGVHDAEFAYPQGTGLVTYDTTLVSDSGILAELGRATGFEASIREAAAGGHR